MRRWRQIGLGLVLMSMSLAAQAFHASDDGRLTLSGFGTLGLVHSDNSEAEFLRDIGQPKGAGEGWSARVDSLLGAQLGWRFDPRWDLVVQGISRYHDSGNYRPELSWAFVRYRPDPVLQLRAGRLGWDVFQLADSRYVGYAYPWARPPVDQFGMLQLTHIDGADVTFKQPLGSDLVLLKLYAGSSDSRIHVVDDLIADFDADAVYGGHLDYEHGPWRLRTSYTEVRSDVDYAGSIVNEIDSLQVPGLDGEREIERALGFSRLRLFSLGALYDSGPLQVQAMWNRSRTARHHGRIDSALLSVGYRVGQVTPYVAHSRAMTSSTNPDVTDIDQRTWTFGTRFDVARDIALKVQLDRIDTRRPGFLWRGDSDWEGGWSSIFSLGLDFIF